MRSPFRVCSHKSLFAASPHRPAAILLAVSLSRGAMADQPAKPLAIAWTNNLLTVTDQRLPGAKLEIWYLEAFCRSGAHDRDWARTVLPHKTILVHAERSFLEFQTKVEPEIVVDHYVRAAEDELEMGFEFKNLGKAPVDLQWFEPACIRVATFTGATQSNYTSQSFIFTSKGFSELDQLSRTTQARYLGGQVYLPDFIQPQDANPRPLCMDHPTNGLIGCMSADRHWLLATASDHTHELFEGVYVCLHSDPRLNGLAPGETKSIRSKIYFLPNDREKLLERYRHDFPRRGKDW